MFNIIKPLSEKRTVLISLVLLFLVIPTQASEVKIHALLQTSSDQLIKKIDDYFLFNSVYEKVMPSVNYEGELPISLEQANFKVQLGPVITKKIEDTNTLLSSIDEISTKAAIKNLRIQGIIEKEINGIKFKIKIDSECKDVNFELITSGNQIESQISSSGIITKLNYLGEKINFKPFSCTAVQGIESYLTEKIIELLKNRISLQELVAEKINHEINDKIQNFKKTETEKANKLFQQMDPDIKVVFGSQKFYKDYISTEIELQTSAESLLPETQQRILTPHTGKQSALVIDKLDLEFLIKNALHKKIKNTKLSSNEIPALKKLLNSRFKQFFVWPALMKRPKGLPLEFVPTIESFSFALAIEQVINQVNFKVTVGQWAIDQLKPMVYFRSAADFQSKSDSELQLVRLNNSYVWSNEYLKSKNVSQRISLGLVNSTLENLIQEKINNEILQNKNSFLKLIQSYYLSRDNILEIVL